MTISERIATVCLSTLGITFSLMVASYFLKVTAIIILTTFGFHFATTC